MPRQIWEIGGHIPVKTALSAQGSHAFLPQLRRMDIENLAQIITCRRAFIKPLTNHVGKRRDRVHIRNLHSLGTESIEILQPLVGKITFRAHMMLSSLLCRPGIVLLSSWCRVATAHIYNVFACPCDACKKSALPAARRKHQNGTS